MSIEPRNDNNCVSSQTLNHYKPNKLDHWMFYSPNISIYNSNSIFFLTKKYIQFVYAIQGRNENVNERLFQTSNIDFTLKVPNSKHTSHS